MAESTFEQHLNALRAFIGVSDEDFETMRQHAAYAAALLNFIVEVLIEHPETRSTIVEAKVDPEELKQRLGRWLIDVLMSGQDTPDFWRRQFRIGYAHLKQTVSNRYMVGLASRIKGLVLPLMVQELGPEGGVQLFLAFQRFLDTIVALTSTLVEETQQRMLYEAFNIRPALAERLERMLFERVRDEFLQKHRGEFEVS